MKRRYMVVVLALIALTLAGQVAPALARSLVGSVGAAASGLAPSQTDPAPPPPTGLTAEADNHSVTLAWDESSVGDLRTYVLEYKRSSEQWKQVLIHDASATTYTVRNLINYERYKFRLKAQDNDLTWSDYSEVVFATPADATLIDLRVDGVTVEGFSPDTLTYDVPLAFGTAVVPTVTATVSDLSATAIVADATGLPGSTTVVVTSKVTKDGAVQRTYTVDFALPFTVSFDSNGGGDVAPIHVHDGEALGRLPVPNRPGSIFLGWYIDDNSFEDAVAENTLVTSDLVLYARYAEVAGDEGTDRDLFASAMDCEPDLAFSILSADPGMTAEAVKEALQLEVLGDATPPTLSVSGSDGTYTVVATEGYTPGSSYKLKLTNSALSFEDEPASVRTYCFSIYRAPVLNVRVDSDVAQIPAGAIGDMTINGAQARSTSVPLASVGTGLTNIEDTGTFTYSGSEPLAVGDVLAIYTGTPLEQRDPTMDYSDEPVAYVEVVAIDGSTVTYRTADAQEVLFTPDVLPVDEADDLDGDPDNGAITIAVSDMTYTGVEFAEMGLDGDTVVEEGDFLAISGGSVDGVEAPVTFARIDSVHLGGGDYVITYSDVSEDEMASAMDLSSSYDMSLDQATEVIDYPAIEAEIERQAAESGFVSAAAEYLTEMAQKTDRFQGQLGDVSLLGESGDGPTAEISDLTWRAEISNDLQHWDGLNGLRCAVTVSFNVTYGENMQIHLSGTFEEEVRATARVDGGALWRTKRVNLGLFYIRVPYIADYKMDSAVDIYNYTGIDIAATLTTSEGTLDIAQQIQDMMGSDTYQDEEISAETREFYELYGDMLANEHDYVQVFSKEIHSQEGPVDPLHVLAYRLSFDFVVNTDVNLSLGCHFAYEKATRYSFTLLLFAKQATSDQTDLVDESYNFQFYVMGTMGLRAGIVVRIELGLFTCKAGSIGVEAETGPYARMWGYFFYELDHRNDVTTSTTSGALYLEIGLYLEVRFLAQAIDGKYSYNPTLYENEWPLYHAGSRQNTFDFSYVLTDETDDIYLKGDGTTYALPSSVFSMQQLDLTEGDVTVAPHSSSDFTIAFTNGRFAQANGVLTVDPPLGQDIAEGYMTIYWNGGPLSFTTVPISRTFHVVWDDLADSYAISFDSRGGSLVGAIVGAYGSPVTLPSPTRAGYTFGGWYDNEACSGEPYTAVTMPASNVQLFAAWTPDPDASYTVRHYLQTVAGSAYELAATQTFTGITGTEVSPAVNDYPGFGAPAQQTVIISGGGSTVVEYYYPRNSYQLTFRLGNGDPDVTRTVTYGAEIAAPQVIRNGYEFDAWYSDAGLSSIYDFGAYPTMPAEPLTLYAGWIPTSAHVAISNELSSGADGAVTVGGFVHDTVTLTWDAPTDDVPTGSIKVTMRTPSGQIWVVCNQTIAPTSSPFSFTTTDQGLSELGLYQFKAEYIPDADSIFPGVVSDFEPVAAVKPTVTISTVLSSGVDAAVPSPAWVNDTITVSWDAPPGMVPTGSVRVTGTMPDGHAWVVCDQPVTATTSPFVFTTTDQGLGTGEWWEGGLLGPGLYRFQAEYIPDGSSLFAGAVGAVDRVMVGVASPVFAWEEISETGTVVADPGGGIDGFYDDFTFGPLPVGFSFPFYGQAFDSFYASTNGWISFAEPTSSFNVPTALPNRGEPFDLVAPFWDDLSVEPTTQNIYYLYDGEKLIVEYKNVHRYGDLGVSYTFEVFLYPDGRMVFQYQSMSDPRAWATVGVQDGTGSEGLQIVCSEAYVEDGLSVLVWQDPATGTYMSLDSLGRFRY